MHATLLCIHVCAMQVSIYACLYTSRASNLAAMSARRSFRPVRDIASHDQLLESGDRCDNSTG
jgi:5' nucleotidase family